MGEKFSLLDRSNGGNQIFNVDVEQNVPGWPTFHSMIRAKITTPTVIGNCRSVPASPTDISVVYTVLVNIKKMLNNVGQDPAIITCDEEIYTHLVKKHNGKLFHN